MFKETNEGQTNYCTHRDDKDVLQCRICLPEKTINPLQQLREEQMKKYKKYFESNLLDGDDIDDCGGAIIDAKDVFEIMNEFHISSLKEYGEAVIGEIEILPNIFPDIESDDYDIGYKNALSKVVEVIKESLK